MAIEAAFVGDSRLTRLLTRYRGTEVMNDDLPNPYESPAYEAVAEVRAHRTQQQALELRGTVAPARLWAAMIDEVIAGILLAITVGLLSGDKPAHPIAVVAAIGPALGYFFLTEWLLGGTVGKLIFKLRVRHVDGNPCTARQAAIRTVLRLAEVNPLLFGYLPAAVTMLITRQRQRIGDLVAHTIVVRKRDLEAYLRETSHKPEGESE